MMATPKTKYLIWFMALALIMACVPTFAAPPVPTTDPNAISTIIIQTANAASTQTSVAMPTFTPTVTFTPTPRNTNTPEPTATSTVIFLFFSPTSIIIPTLVPPNGSNSGGSTSSKSYACEVVSVSPAYGATFGNRVDFDAKWKVKNIGKKNWDKNSVDYVYSSGDKFHKVAGYDLSKTINVGDIVDLIADMQSPKNPGTYTTHWAMQVGSEIFCALNLTIVVN